MLALMRSCRRGSFYPLTEWMATTIGAARRDYRHLATLKCRFWLFCVIELIRGWGSLRDPKPTHQCPTAIRPTTHGGHPFIDR